MELDIKNYIEANIIELTGKMYPIFTTEIKGLSAVYFFSHNTLDYVSDSQLEIRILTADYDEAKEIEGKLDELLAANRDDKYTIYGNTKFRVERSGGGCLYQGGVQMFENTLFYQIKWRKLNG